MIETTWLHVVLQSKLEKSQRKAKQTLLPARRNATAGKLKKGGEGNGNWEVRRKSSVT